MAKILSLWTWHPSVIVGCIGLIAAYWAAVNFRPQRRFLFFLGGVIMLLISLESPLDVLGDTYLFSAHMLQHQLLILVVPPLLLLGIPESAASRIKEGIERIFHARDVQRSAMLNRGQEAPHQGARGMGLTRIACFAFPWLIGVGMIWVWHLPRLYNAALEDERVHLVEHLSFLMTSTLFWWPILSPLERVGQNSRRLLAQAAYLLLAAVACDILGNLLAYAPPGLYPAYVNPIDVYGILPLLREGWGISPAVDQQAGGLLMGFTGDLVYVLAAFSAMAKWYRARIGRNKTE
jgi:putative membrane protein